MRTGARLMDLARLGWNSVDLVNGIIAFVQSKTGAKVVIPVDPVLAERLLSIATDQGGPLCPVFIRYAGHRPQRTGGSNI